MRALSARVAALDPRARAALGLLGLLAVSFLLRSTALHGRYWIDEGLSVGIAAFPLDEIPGALRQDGSPPLYYLLLGVWTRLIGDGEARTHALSLLFALLAIPSAFLLARRLLDERVAWCAAGIAALIPFLTYYAQETRMYALAALLSLVVAGTYALAFLAGRRGWLAAFAVAGAALLYTHNWGLFLLAGTGLALLPALRAGTVPWRDALLGYGGVVLLYLPWLPTLLDQAAHTGAPWSMAPALRDVPGELATVFGGEGPAIAVLLAGGAGAARLLRGPDASGLEARVTRTLAGALLIALALAFVASAVSPAWAGRYLAAFLGPLVLLAALGLARAGTLGVAAMALLAALWLQPATKRVNTKSNVHHVSVVAADRLSAGDVVVSTHPEQVPVAAFYFPEGLRWADGLGWVPDTRLFDWRDALDRYRAARPRDVAARIVAGTPPGRQLVLMQPILRTANWEAPWTRLVQRRAKQWERVLDRDPRLARGAALPRIGHRDLPKGIRLVLYRRR